MHDTGVQPGDTAESESEHADAPMRAVDVQLAARRTCAHTHPGERHHTPHRTVGCQEVWGGGGETEDMQRRIRRLKNLLKQTVAMAAMSTPEARKAL